MLSRGGREGGVVQGGGVVTWSRGGGGRCYDLVPGWVGGREVL